MSESYSHQEVEANVPRFERWLAVLGSAFIPAVLIVFLPASFDLPLIIATAVLLLIGLAMLVTHSRDMEKGR
jgi:hypothetical protein